MNKFWDVFVVLSVRTKQKNTVKRTKLHRLGTNKDEDMMLCNWKTDQENTFAYLGSIISQDGECNEDSHFRIGKAQGVTSWRRKKKWKTREINF